MALEIVIGTRKWSSWSLRPWLVLKRSGLDFTETVVPLRALETTEAAIRRAGSPSGLVPALKEGDLVVWDSLAICERIAELSPGLWPADAKDRARARSACSEIHAGFHSLRGECPMDLSKTPVEVTLSEATHKDLRRLVELVHYLGQAGGQGEDGFLFGRWCVADAFLTPIATRIRTYGVRLSDFGDTGAAGRYLERLLETPEFLAWEEAAAAEL